MQDWMYMTKEAGKLWPEILIFSKPFCLLNGLFSHFTYITLMFPSCYRYGTGTLTKVFMDRVFQECLTYDGEMDYKTYLDFVLAMENRHEPQSLQYLFRILDINNKGYLDTFCLNYFFRVSNTSHNFTVSNAIHTFSHIKSIANARC